MKPWKLRGVLLVILTLWSLCQPAVSYGAEAFLPADSFPCQYLNFILRPFGVCHEIPAAPTVVSGVALSPVQKKFNVVSVPALPSALVPQVLGVTTTSVPKWSVPAAFTAAINSQKDTMAPLTQIAP